MASKKKKRPAAPPPPARSKPPRAAATPTGPGRKEEVRAARQRADKRDALKRRLITAGLVVAALAAVGAYVVADRRGDEQLRQALTSGSCTVDTETDPTAPAGQSHVPAPSYAVDPPAGGDHLASAARAGVYEGQQVPPDGQLVHSLEHGYVIAWHAPGVPTEQLAAFAAEHEGDVIVAERPGLPVPVAATAWGQRLLCEQVEPAALSRFFEAHVGNGPEDVARG